MAIGPRDTLPPTAPILPARIKIGWCDYQLEVWRHRDAVGADRYGETSHTSRTIRVDLGYGTNQAAATLLHEIMHAISAIWALKDSDDEERTVRILQHGLSTVWRDNPQVMNFIGHHLQHGD